MSLPVPIPTPDTLPFWEGTSAGELRIQFCHSCADYYFYPRPFCPRCSSDDVEWRTVSGNATLVSYIINHRPLAPFDPETPLVVALIQLDEGPRMMTNLVDVDPDPACLELDMRLSVRFIDRGEQQLPVFAPAGEAA